MLPVSNIGRVRMYQTVSWMPKTSVLFAVKILMVAFGTKA